MNTIRVLIVAFAIALASCDTRPATAEWQRVCVGNRSEFTHFQPVPSGRGSMILVPQYRTVCVRRDVQCVAGRDGTTTCPSERPIP